ncbi:AIR carboxylase family protein [Patescibacteria group bacterium]|nr:AIR carboxylase family protein [Patescibacteria group bacterium]MCL5797752.1 AIR carboxylase family protein [Patescibacteria group bacterium]
MVVIILGSKSDLPWGEKISQSLKGLEVENKIRIGSAHKTPEYLSGIVKKYEKEDVVYICVAGRSNALGGYVDAQTAHPVINCPPYSDKYSGMDILSSLRMPSGVGAVTVLEPEQAAVAAAKILASTNVRLRNKIRDYQKSLRDKVISEDKSL